MSGRTTLVLRLLPAFLVALLAVSAAWTVEAAQGGAGRALKKQFQLPATPYRYVAEAGLPHFFDNTPRHNPTTDAGVALGRVLFHDPLLSSNGKVSCATCHDQKRAFAERRRTSRGVHGRKGRRNALSLVNLRFHPTDRYFWDERAGSIEEQVLLPIQDPLEMAMPLELLPHRVRLRKAYKPLFREAFGDESITTLRIAQALAQFVRSLVSTDSKYDRGLAQVDDVLEDFPNFTKQENLGKQIFFQGGRGGSCASCHVADARRGRGRGRRGPPRFRDSANKPVLFVGRFASNNGLDADLDARDGGLGEVTGDQEDLGVFKAPSLRNIAVTAPYMHDGRLRTLEAVIEHYNREVEPHPNLDGRLTGRRTDGPRRLGLSSKERRALVAFLKTLTDEAFLKDPRFSDPFR